MFVHCSLHFWRFTEYCTPTNALSVMSYTSLKLCTLKLSLLLHVLIAHCISSSGSTYISWLKSLIKIMNISLWWVMWQHHVVVCALFLVHGGKWTALLVCSTQWIFKMRGATIKIHFLILLRRYEWCMISRTSDVWHSGCILYLSRHSEWQLVFVVPR
jgi:hypothetical protein